MQSSLWKLAVIAGVVALCLLVINHARNDIAQQPGETNENVADSQDKPPHEPADVKQDDLDGHDFSSEFLDLPADSEVATASHTAPPQDDTHGDHDAHSNDSGLSVNEVNPFGDDSDGAPLTAFADQDEPEFSDETPSTQQPAGVTSDSGIPDFIVDPASEVTTADEPPLTDDALPTFDGALDDDPVGVFDAAAEASAASDVEPIDVESTEELPTAPLITAQDEPEETEAAEPTLMPLEDVSSAVSDNDPFANDAFGEGESATEEPPLETDFGGNVALPTASDADAPEDTLEFSDLPLETEPIEMPAENILPLDELDGEASESPELIEAPVDELPSFGDEPSPAEALELDENAISGDEPQPIEETAEPSLEPEAIEIAEPELFTPDLTAPQPIERPDTEIEPAPTLMTPEPEETEFNLEPLPDNGPDPFEQPPADDTTFDFGDDTEPADVPSDAPANEQLPSPDLTVGDETMEPEEISAEELNSGEDVPATVETDATLEPEAELEFEAAPIEEPAENPEPAVIGQPEFLPEESVPARNSHTDDAPAELPQPAAAPELEPQPAAEPAEPETVNEDVYGEGTVKVNSPRGPQKPQLTIEKQSPPSAILGKPFVYSIIVKNVGETAAGRVVVEDEIPRGAKLTGTIPQAELIGKKLIWRFGTLHPNQQRKISIRVIPVSEGPVGSVATVNFVAEVAAQTVVKKPELNVRITAPEEARIGKPLTFQFHVSNTGSTVARKVVLRDILPPQLRHPGGNDLEYAIGDLAPGKTRDVQLTLTAAEVGEALNQAIVTAEGDISARAEAKVNIKDQGIAVIRTGPKTQLIRRAASYTTSIRNKAKSPVSDIVVVEQIPEGMKFLKATEGGNYDPQKQTVTWHIQQIGGEKTEDVSVMLMPEAPGTKETIVHVYGEEGQIGTTKAATAVRGFSKLDIEITHADQPIEVGERVSYRVKIHNRGTERATGVLTSVLLPEEMKLIDAKGPVDHQQAARQIDFAPIATIPPQEHIIFDLLVEAQAAGDTRLQVQIQSDQMTKPLNRETATLVYTTQK